MRDEMSGEVIEQKEFSFGYRVISGRIVVVNSLTKEELDVEIEKGYADVAVGCTFPPKKCLLTFARNMAYIGKMHTCFIIM